MLLQFKLYFSFDFAQYQFRGGVTKKHNLKHGTNFEEVTNLEVLHLKSWYQRWNQYGP